MALFWLSLLKENGEKLEMGKIRTCDTVYTD